MKIVSIILCSSILSTFALAQTDKTIDVGAQLMSSGGSYYDVARNSKINKYGAERISPSGYGFQLGVVSDHAGNLFIRYLSLKKNDDRTPLEKQATISYQTPNVKIGKSEKVPLTYFINGQVLYYSQIDHHVYAVSDEITPLATGNNKWTVIAPSVGAKYDAEYARGDFDFNAEVSAIATPAGFIQSKTTVLNEDRVQAAMFGGALKLKTVIRYKNRYYFKIDFSQNYFQSYDQSINVISANNRIGQCELGYLFNKRLGVNLFASNSELVLINTDRRAIDVFNSFGAGVKYKIHK